MILRRFDPGTNDAAHLRRFRCSTGQPYEDHVETWIRNDATAWANDTPAATFQRRTLALVEDHTGDPVAVVAWQDITRVDLEGIWIEVLAVALEHQHTGQGRAVYELTVEHLRTIDRNGDHLAALVHTDNHRSKRLLASASWNSGTLWDDHELWVGSL